MLGRGSPRMGPVFVGRRPPCLSFGPVYLSALVGKKYVPANPYNVVLGGRRAENVP